MRDSTVFEGLLLGLGVPVLLLCMVVLASLEGCTPPPRPSVVVAGRPTAPAAIPVAPAHMYRLTLEGQLTGAQVVDSVISWSTVNGIRIERLGHRGPLVFAGGVWSLVNIEEMQECAQW